jgi:hypothetical protein
VVVVRLGVGVATVVVVVGVMVVGMEVVVVVVVPDSLHPHHQLLSCKQAEPAGQHVSGH